MKIKKQTISQHYEKRKKEVLSKNNQNNTSMWHEKEAIRNKIYDALIKEDFVVVEVGVRLAENACMLYLRDPKKMYLIEDVLRDLNAWSEKIKIGGYIVGDDYFGKTNPDKRVKWKQHNYGVIEAVHKFLEENKNFEIFHIDEEKTFPLKAGQFVIKRVY